MKSINDVDDCGFDDEISSIEIAYLAKNFINFLRNNNKMARNRNNANNKNVKKNEITKNNNSKKSKDKVIQSSNNSLGQQCFSCQGYGHLRSECPTYLRSKGKAMSLKVIKKEISWL